MSSKRFGTGRRAGGIVTARPAYDSFVLYDAAWHARIARVFSGALGIWGVAGTVGPDPEDPNGFVIAPRTGPEMRVSHSASAGWAVTLRDLGFRRGGRARPPRRAAGPAAAAARGARAGRAGGPPRDRRAADPRPRRGRALTMAAVPVAVITGFLGSGKTTLLASLLRDPALARTAVIVNEFGEVGLDHLLVEASDEEIVLLDSGCVCCSVRGDLVRTAGEPARTACRRRDRAVRAHRHRDDRTGRPGADPAGADDRPRDRRFACPRVGDRHGRCGRRRRHARRPPRIRQAGGDRRPHRRHQDRSQRPGGERPFRAPARAQSRGAQADRGARGRRRELAVRRRNLRCPGRPTYGAGSPPKPCRTIRGSRPRPRGRPPRRRRQVFLPAPRHAVARGDADAVPAGPGGALRRAAAAPQGSRRRPRKPGPPGGDPRRAARLSSAGVARRVAGRGSHDAHRRHRARPGPAVARGPSRGARRRGGGAGVDRPTGE